jgi:hypothetical protein
LKTFVPLRLGGKEFFALRALSDLSGESIRPIVADCKVCYNAAVAPCSKQPSFWTTAAYANDDLGAATIPGRFIPLWHPSFPFGTAFTFADCPHDALIPKSTLDRNAHVSPSRGTPSDLRQPPVPSPPARTVGHQIY